MKKHSLNDLISMGVMYEVSKSYSEGSNWFPNSDFVIKINDAVILLVDVTTKCTAFYNSGGHIQITSDDKIFDLFEFVLVQR